VPALAQATALAAGTTYDLLVGDLRGSVHQFDGTTWTTRVLENNVSIGAIWRTDDTHAWAGTSTSNLYAFDGGTWSPVALATTGSIRSIWGAASDLWVASASELHRFDGQQWIDRTPAAGLTLARGAGTGPDDAWVISQTATTDTLWHYDGAWTIALQTPKLRNVLALAPDLVWVLTATGLVRYDGMTWMPTDLPNLDELEHIAASAADDIVVASRSELFHFDGSTWSPMRIPPVVAFNTVIAGLAAAPNRIDVLTTAPTLRVVFSLFRTQPWVCKATETTCANAVDDDCDGAIDTLDAECP
jgi:hypothetical protein